MRTITARDVQELVKLLAALTDVGLFFDVEPVGSGWVVRVLQEGEK